MYGSIPSELGWLGSTLEEINLSYNTMDFTSNIPNELNSLTHLNALFLQGNYNYKETSTDGTTDEPSSSSTTTTLNDVFCNETSTTTTFYDNVISEFVADCHASKGNVRCLCCTLCCDEDDNCTDENVAAEEDKKDTAGDVKMLSIS